METYATEEQQVEAIKKWFTNYGNMLSWIIIAVLGAILAYKYWFHHKETVLAQASDTYMGLLKGLETKDTVTVQNEADKLMGEYQKSPYAVFSALTLASEKINQNQFDEAISQLKWVIENSQYPDYQALARVRLMRVYMTQEKWDEALALYNEKQARGYLPLMAELKGDILVKQNKPDDAKEAYTKALQASPKEGMHSILLKMKLEELGIDPNVISLKESKAVKS